MKSISSSKDIPLAPDAVFDAVSEVVRQLARRSEHGQVSLDVPLIIRNMDRLADVSVPVTISCAEAEPAHTITVEVNARKAGGLFPRFTGTIDVQPTGPSRSVLRLRGDYEVPLGWLGERIDDTLMQNCARASLGELLTHIAAAAQEHVAASANARYSRGHD